MEIPITGSQIISAVCRKLATKYPQPIHKDTFDDGWQEPCFFVWNSKTETSPVVWPRFEQSHNIEVRYYPKERSTQNSEFLEMGAALVDLLHVVTLREDNIEHPVFATTADYRIIDNSLSFSTTYKTEGYFEQQPSNLMNEMIEFVKSN